MSRICALPLDESQVGTVFGQPFPQTTPSLSLRILSAGQILGQWFCTWVGVLVPPLEVLPGYRRCQLQAPYPSLLGVSTRATPITSWFYPMPGLWQIPEMPHLQFPFSHMVLSPALPISNPCLCSFSHALSLPVPSLSPPPILISSFA